MALVWSHEAEGNLYELRSAGASLRLYRNGVHHSQWNPNRPLSGSVWDLITLPALHRPVGSVREALMLGFGAGAVARQLVGLAGVERLVGVELDPMHLSIAQGFFGCDEGFELVAADAVEWVRDEAGASRYDLVVDDLYGEEEGVPERFAPMDRDWYQSLADLLRPDGILVVNTIEPEKINRLSLLHDPKLRSRFPIRKMYQLDGYENRVLAFGNRAFDRTMLQTNLRDICRAYPGCFGVGRRYISSEIE